MDIEQKNDVVLLFLLGAVSNECNDATMTLERRLRWFEVASYRFR